MAKIYVGNLPFSADEAAVRALFSQHGTVESVAADGVVVATGTARAKIPLASFGKSDRGLVISVTRAQLEAAVSAQSPS